jgi:hypothetical protein
LRPDGSVIVIISRSCPNTYINIKIREEMSKYGYIMSQFVGDILKDLPPIDYRPRQVKQMDGEWIDFYIQRS